MSKTVLMGGSGSTGSSLIRRMLDRHPQTFSGGELNFFNKEQIFNDWPSAGPKVINCLVKRRQWLRKRFTTSGWFPYPGHNLLSEEYGWNKEELVRLLENSPTLEDFVSNFFSKPLGLHKASHWVEKTPSNSYSFRAFLSHFPEGKVVHTTRNPYDAVASLVRRGFTPTFAAGIWVYNTGAALGARTSSRYLAVRYEDLVDSPEEEVSTLLEFLGVDVDPAVFRPDESSQPQVEGWQNSAASAVSSKSVGGFKRMPTEAQEEIRTALSVFEIRPDVAGRKGIQSRTCRELCNEPCYEFSDFPNSKYLTKIRNDMRKDLLRRTIRRFETELLAYPARIQRQGRCPSNSSSPRFLRCSTSRSANWPLRASQPLPRPCTLYVSLRF